MLTLDWNDYCTRWHASIGSSQAGKVMQSLKTALTKVTSDFAQDDIDWLIEALRDENRKWFVARVVSIIQPNIPESLFAPLIRAAVYEVDVSSNRQFVEPCAVTFGYPRVNVALLEFFKRGTTLEKAGAANALYWAQPLIPSDQLEKAIRERHENPIWLETQRLFLQEFVSNSDIWLRRSIIGKLQLVDTEIYPDDVKPLVDDAIRIARAHPDDYIRQRIEIQLGT